VVVLSESLHFENRLDCGRSFPEKCQDALVIRPPSLN
jgi:hypothetical protein